MANYYPPASFFFEVKVAGAPGGVDASFAEVSGLDAERKTIEVAEGGENRFVHHLPGAIKHGNLVLKRGLMLASSQLYDWCKATLESDLTRQIEPKDISVSLLDEKAAPLMTWSVTGAWPVKWQVAALRARDNEVARETLEMAFTRIQREVNKPLAAAGTFTD